MAEEGAGLQSGYVRQELYETPTRYTRRPPRARRTRARLTQINRQRDTETQDSALELTLGMGDIEQHVKIGYSDDESSVDEDYDVASLAESIDEQLTWRGRMQASLHNQWFHVVIVCLVVMDALIVLFELLLDVGAFGNIHCTGETFIEQAEFCHLDSESRDSCGPHADLILKGQNISASSGRGIGNTDLCVCKIREGERVCVYEDVGDEVNPAEVLHITSLVILSIFMVEIIVKIIAFRLKYFTHKFEVFDGMVVVLSWILDIASLQQEEAFEAASLLIILRLWRVVRIVNGAVLSAKAQSDTQLHEAKHQARKIIHAFHKCQDKLDLFEEENENMKRLLKENKKKRFAQQSQEKAREAKIQHQPLIQDDDHDSDEEIQGIHISVAPPPALPGASNGREASQPSSHTGAGGGDKPLELVSITPEVGGLETVEEGKENEEVTEV